MRKVEISLLMTILIICSSLALNILGTFVLEKAETMPDSLVRPSHSFSCSHVFAGDEQKCSKCDGDKKCAVCWGSGENISGEDCSICNGSGKCYYCSGTGKS